MPIIFRGAKLEDMQRINVYTFLNYNSTWKSERPYGFKPENLSSTLNEEKTGGSIQVPQAQGGSIQSSNFWQNFTTWPVLVSTIDDNDTATLITLQSEYPLESYSFLLSYTNLADNHYCLRDVSLVRRKLTFAVGEDTFDYDVVDLKMCDVIWFGMEPDCEYCVSNIPEGHVIKSPIFYIIW